MHDSQVSVKLLFFAKARELTGKNEAVVEVHQNIKGSDLLHFLLAKFNLECIGENVILSLNENYVDLDSNLKLNNADELAIIPPLSGGWFSLHKNFSFRTYKQKVYNIYI